MSAWILAVLICVRASAAAVEIAPAAAPSASIGAAGAASTLVGGTAISLVPSGAVLAPSLGSSLTAAPAPLSPAAIRAALGVPAAAGRAALAADAAPALPAAAAPAAAEATADAVVPAQSAVPTSAAAGIVPPARTAGAAQSAARISAAASLAVGAAPELPAPGRSTPEEAAAAGRAFWDHAAERGRLDGAAFVASSAAGAARPASLRRPAGAPAAAFAGADARDAIGAFAPPAPATLGASAEFGPGGFLLRTMLGVPVAAQASAGGAATFPAKIERLTLSLGAGLVVRVRGAWAHAFSSPALRRGGRAQAAARRAAPLTSTRWLERRGWIETESLTAAPAFAASGPSLARSLGVPAVPAAPDVSAATAAATAAAAAALAAPRSRPGLVGTSFPIRADSGSPLAWWALAFLPATLALLRDPLR